MDRKSIVYDLISQELGSYWEEMEVIPNPEPLMGTRKFEGKRFRGYLPLRSLDQVLSSP